MLMLMTNQPLLGFVLMVSPYPQPLTSLLPELSDLFIRYQFLLLKDQDVFNEKRLDFQRIGEGRYTTPIRFDPFGEKLYVLHNVSNTRLHISACCLDMLVKISFELDDRDESS